MADMNVASNQAGIFPKKLTPIHQEALDKIEGEGGNKKKIDTEAEVNKLANYLNGGNLDKADKEILEKKIEEGKNTIYQNEVSKEARKEIESHLEKGQVKSYNDAKALADMLLDDNLGDLTKKHIRNFLLNSDYKKQLLNNSEYKAALNPPKMGLSGAPSTSKTQLAKENNPNTSKVDSSAEAIDSRNKSPESTKLKNGGGVKKSKPKIIKDSPQVNNESYNPPKPPKIKQKDIVAGEETFNLLNGYTSEKDFLKAYQKIKVLNEDSIKGFVEGYNRFLNNPNKYGAISVADGICEQLYSEWGSVAHMHKTNAINKIVVCTVEYLKKYKPGSNLIAELQSFDVRFCNEYDMQELDVLINTAFKD